MVATVSQAASTAHPIGMLDTNPGDANHDAQIEEPSRQCSG
jgi:hypothetical protein